MKIRLPYLSALALTAIVMAAVAQRSLVRGQSSDMPIAPPPGFVDRRSTEDASAYTTDPASPAAAQQAEDDGSPVGDRLVRQAIRQMGERDSITSHLHYTAKIDGAQINGKGDYWQQGKGEDLQTRLELQIVEQEASLLQTSNGRYLWIDRQLPASRVVTCIALFELRSDMSDGAVDGAPASDDWPTDFEVRSRTHSPDMPLIAASGGLRGLLASLSESFSFMPPQSMRMSITPKREDGVELPPKNVEVPVFVVVGHWKQQRLAGLMHVEGPKSKEKAGEAAQEKPIPDRLPQEVLLLFGQKDLFPYRVEYRGLETPPVNENGAPPVYNLSASPLLSLELTDVKFDTPLASGLFDYTPQNAVWTYQTPAVRERIRGQRQQKVAEKVRPATR